MMNRGLGSIMGYRGGGMPVARFQAGGDARSPEQLFQMLPSNWDSFGEQQKMSWFNNNNVTTQELLNVGVPAGDIEWMRSQPNGYRGAATVSSPPPPVDPPLNFTDAQVAQYFAENPGLSEAQIAEAMRQTGVSPEQVARVTGADPGYVSQQYNNYLNQGTAQVSEAARAEAARAEAARVEAARVEALATDISTRFYDALRAGNRQAALRVMTEGQAAFPGEDLFSIAASNVSREVSPEAFRTISRGDNVATADDIRYYLIEEPQQIAEDISTRFFNALNAGDRQTALSVMTEGQAAFPESNLFDIAASNIGNAASSEALRIIGGADSVVTADELRSYLTTTGAGTETETETGAGTETDTDTVIDTSTEGRDELTGGTTLPAPDRYSQVPEYTRQQASGFSFAPIQRGLGQLRGPAYMPGLLQARTRDLTTGLPGGFSKFTPAQKIDYFNRIGATPQELLAADPTLTQEGLDFMRREGYIGGVSRDSPSFGGTGLSQGQVLSGIQPYAQRIERGAEPDLVIQDYISNEMIPQGLSPAEVAAASPTLSLGATQQYYNQFAPQGVFSTAAPGRTVLPKDFVLQTGAYTTPVTAINPITGEPYVAPREFINAGMDEVNSPNIVRGVGRAGGVVKDNKIIKMAEGGETMSRLSAAEAGSTFDIADYLDEQGRLVGGYSKPIYDENQVIIGYDYRPYERDVVFGEELREKEAAMRPTDEEREQMMVEMAMRQGRTGVDPRMGGLAGIEIGDPMMRKRPQYYSTVEESRPRYAEGGLASVAQNLADKGRKGDSMLVHMTPDEVAGLQALAQQMGGSLTINPETGLPEANFFKKLFKAASFILPFVPIPGLFGMSSLLTKSILSGIAAGASAKGGFDLKQALGGGLSAYALGSLGEKLSGATTPGGTPTTPTTTSVPDAAAVNPMGSVTGVVGEIPSPSELGQYQGVGGAQGAPVNMYGSYSDTAGGIQTAPRVSIGPNIEAAAPIDTYTLRGGPQTGEAFYNTVPSDAVTTTPGSLPPGADTVPGRMANVITPEGEGFGKPLTKGTEIAMAGLGGLSIQEGAKEQRRYDMEAAAIRREEEERERRFEELARRTLGRVNVKSGGQINLAKGGMTYMEAGGTTDVTGEPRMVQGTGDGMSDSVPATIEGVQEARLANDEFVIPADVVADIGNGSSNAGAKKLYDMMDRIRKARHGTTEQPPEIRAERLMPA